MTPVSPGETYAGWDVRGRGAARNREWRMRLVGGEGPDT